MFTYRLFFVLLTPVLFIHIVWKAIQCRQWLYFKQRLGFSCPAKRNKVTWFHCASVGEVKTVLPLLEKLHQTQPEQHFVITSHTATSRELVVKSGQPWLSHMYLPLDWRSAIKRFLHAVKPERCILFETEIWPNLIDLCDKQRIPVTIINGRLSSKTMNQPAWLASAYRYSLPLIDNIYTRSEQDRERYIKLGADEKTTTTLGDLKLAGRKESDGKTQAVTRREYILVVSTHDDEEVQITRHCQALLEQTLFVIAPRHPHRSNTVAKQLHHMGLNIAIHSKRDAVKEDTHIYLIDSIGELDAWYPGAQSVVVGGSFVNTGGHNIIEPLAFDKAVVYGPNMQNFSDLNALVLEHEAAIQVDDYPQLAEQLTHWQKDSTAKNRIEQRAQVLVHQFESTLPAYVEVLTQR